MIPHSIHLPHVSSRRFPLIPPPTHFPQKKSGKQRHIRLTIVLREGAILSLLCRVGLGWRCTWHCSWRSLSRNTSRLPQAPRAEWGWGWPEFVARTCDIRWGAGVCKETSPSPRVEGQHSHCRKGWIGTALNFCRAFNLEQR